VLYKVKMMMSADLPSQLFYFFWRCVIIAICKSNVLLPEKKVYKLGPQVDVSSSRAADIIILTLYNTK
jgi:hypothetical protein